MSGLSARAGRRLTAALLLLATLAFGIGIAIEKAEEGEAGHAEEGLLGIELESTPLVIAGIVVSMVLALALWRSARRIWMLELTALFCLGFAVLDGIEVSRKWGDETTIAALALAAMVLHAGAAVTASLLARRFASTHLPNPPEPGARRQ